MTWPTSYGLRDSAVWFNPWPIKYLLPAEKRRPLYWPNAKWSVIQFPPQYDEFGNMVAPKPPDGAERKTKRLMNEGVKRRRFLGAKMIRKSHL